jgi:S1-C subfamily serine protease
MPQLTRLRKMAAGGLLSAVAVISVACTGGDDDPTATSQPATVSLAVETTAPAGATAVPSVIVPTPPVTEIPVSNPIAELSSVEIMHAQEQVMIDLFADSINSVVRIETRTRTGSAYASGWMWDMEGHIVTNHHVVDGAINIDVFFFDGREYRGRVVGFDSDADLAVVKIDLAAGDEVQPAKLGKSTDLKVGQMAIALGNPFGNEFSMTSGIVSAVGRLMPSGFSNFRIPSVVQTDAAINPGNSGGPLLDIEGRVIGINTRIQSASGSNSGVGFAVPVDLAKRVVPNLIASGEHVYSFIGIRGIEPDNELRTGLGVANTQQGAYITNVEPGTPGQDAGLRGDSGSFGQTDSSANARFDGDLIVAIDGRPVNSMDDLIAYLALNTSPGDDIVVTVLRAGQEDLVVVALTQR